MAWIGALLVGACIGLFGSGSILTIPILVYLVGIPEKIAIAEATAIVGTVSLVATIPYARRRLVDWPTVWIFGAPAMIGSYLGAALAQFVSGATQLLTLAGIMFIAAYMMAKPERGSAILNHRHGERATWKGASDGFLVGVFTGVTGVAGGFLIVPALVLLGGIPMIRAVGTSLAIITLKSFVAYFKYLDVLTVLNLSVDPVLIGQFAGVGILGSFVGKRIGDALPQHRLRQLFAVLILFIAVYIVFANAGELISLVPVLASSQTTGRAMPLHQ